MKISFKVPNNWRAKSIPEVLFFQEGPGVRKHQYKDKGVKLLNVGNIVDGSLDLDKTDRYISEDEAYGKYSHFLVTDGDLVIGSSGITVDTFHKKIAYVKNEHLPLCMNTSTIRFRPLDEKKLYLDFFRYFLGTNFFKNQLRRLITGSAQLNFGPSHLKQMFIPLPSLLEQKRIAAILDKADSIRRKRQAAIKLADDLLRATFLDMFGDPVTNPKGWDTAPLKDFGHITTGNTPSRKRPEFYGDDIEWIKSDNINTPYHFLTKAEEGLSKEGKKVARKVAPYSTLVTCIAGSFDCIGNAALSDRAVAFNQQINAITPREGTDPFFLYCLILNAKKIIQNASTNSMKGMVSKGKFEPILFFKPPTKLQKKFGSFFQNHIESIDKIRTSERLSRDLFNSITQRAFRGEL